MSKIRNHKLNRRFTRRIIATFFVAALASCFDKSTRWEQVEPEPPPPPMCTLGQQRCTQIGVETCTDDGSGNILWAVSQNCTSDGLVCVPMNRLQSNRPRRGTRIESILHQGCERLHQSLPGGDQLLRDSGTHDFQRLLGEAALAQQFSRELFENGVFAMSIGFPTVPRGKSFRSVPLPTPG